MDRRAFLRQSEAELQRRLAALNAAFARELHELRESITMAHELLGADADLAEEEVRALLKTMIQTHPRGAPAARLLAEIEALEERLRRVREAAQTLADP